MMLKHIFLLCTCIAVSTHLFASNDDPVFIDTSSVMQVKLSDVVVNASKDNSKLKELPASISIVTGKEIELNEVNTLAGFDGLIPNLFMPDYGSKLTSPIYIRGIGSRINSPAVGLYVDHVPFFEKASHNIDLFDISSIEVLRGPQGTLYGRNTRGGIINIETISPMQYQGAKIQLSGGDFGYFQGTAGYYGKYKDKLGFSLTGNYKKTNGFFTNQYTGKGADKMNSLSLRNRLIYNINDRLSIENIAFFERSEEGGYPYRVYKSETGVVNPVNYDHPSSYNRDLFNDALIISYRGNGFVLNSTTAFQYLSDLQDVDQDFTPDPLFTVTQDQNINQLYQEITVHSSSENRLDWLVGTSGFMQLTDRAVNVAYGDSGIVRYRLPGPYSYVKTYDGTVKGAALFGQLKYHDFFVPGLTATAGLRMDAEEETLDYKYDKTVVGTTSNVDDITFNSINSLQLLPKFALNYQVQASNVYAQVSKGYKTGGYNSSFEHVDSADFKPEDAWNYEVGMKTSLLNKQLYIDVALFYIDMKNQQIYQTLRSGRGSMLTNAGSSYSQGGELTVKAIPICGFETALNYGYTYAKFNEYVKNENEVFDGNFVPYVPRHTVSLNVNKTLDFWNTDILDYIRFNVLYRGAGETYWNEDNKVKEGYYSVIDAKISFIRNNIQLDIFGKNLLNSSYNSFYFTALGNEYVQTGKPRFVGAKLSVKL